MSIIFSQILVTIGWKAFKGRIDDTVFGNKGEKRESQKNKTHYIVTRFYKYERNAQNILIILSSFFYFTFLFFFNFS